jgi:hypothetical protein
VIFLVWDIPSPLFSSFHFFLSSSPTNGATGGQMWEWYFRTTLDHWSNFFGMVFAANYPVTSLWIKKVESLPRNQEWSIKVRLKLSPQCTVPTPSFCSSFQNLTSRQNI